MDVGCGCGVWGVYMCTIHPMYMFYSYQMVSSFFVDFFLLFCLCGVFLFCVQRLSVNCCVRCVMPIVVCDVDVYKEG